MKSGKSLPRSHVLPRQFLKNSSGDEICEQVHLQEMTQMRLIKQVLVKSSLKDRVTKIIPPLLEMVNYLDWLLLIKSLDHLITWYCNITWQPKIIKSPLLLCLWLPTLQDGDLPWGASSTNVTPTFGRMVLQCLVTNSNLYKSTNSISMATKLVNMVTYLDCLLPIKSVTI